MESRTGSAGRGPARCGEEMPKSSFLLNITKDLVKRELHPPKREKRVIPQMKRGNFIPPPPKKKELHFPKRGSYPTKKKRVIPHKRNKREKRVIPH